MTVECTVDELLLLVSSIFFLNPDRGEM